MTGTTLGIDLGSNSIGWALINDGEKRLIATGVRIFPEGVDRDQQGGEQSKNETRRTKRGTRRQIARRARRKRKLRDLLIGAGLWPSDTGQQDALLSIDPYELRRRALKEAITAHEFGRVLIHLNQRRGFKSNRKSDSARKKETSDMLKEISSLETEIQEGGHRTLGEHLASLRQNPHQKVRDRHTRREMYTEEFDCVWRAQQQHHPDLLTEALRKRVQDLIFFQRNMYWPKSAVGRCELEPKFRRCPRADRLAQRFRLLQEVNNLRMLDTFTGEERALTEEERHKLTEYLSTAKKRSFDEIRKKLNLLEHCKFNFEEGKRTKLLGMQTDAILANKNLFTKEWYSLPNSTKDEIVDTVLNEEDENEVRRKGMEEWGLDAETAQRVSDVDLPPGYMNYSREAIEKLLPHLARGLPLMSGDDSPSAMSEAGYLRPDQRSNRIRKFLPRPPTDLPNPIVRQALHEVRKLMNAIIREYGKPDRIHIELAREVKGSAQRRKEILRQNAERRREREQAAKRIEEHGYKPTSERIKRYRLWEEQNKLCVYSGRTISLAQLFGGGEVNIDHILPRLRSLDDSLANKVICFRSVNAEKGDQTPYEWLAESDPERYEEVLQRARKLPYGKRRKFSQKTVELDEFIHRQLNDTAYISREVLKYVRCLGVDVVCAKGQITAELRHLWGLNKILSKDCWEDHKNRDDHRHHAVDAIVTALADRSRLQQLARSHRQITSPEKEIMPPPWEHFRNDVEEAINAINVSHRAQRKVRGALHEETIYGPTQTPGEFVCRKPIEELTPNMIDEIRDEGIKKIVLERLRQHGIKPERGGSKFSKAVWKEPLTMPSGVPIKKVRLVKRDSSIQPIRNGAAWVKTGSNHHVCIFEFTDEKGRIQRDAVFVTMLEAAKRAKNHKPIIQRTHPDRPEAKFIMSLSINDLVLIEHNGKEDLYRFESAASTSQQMWFRHHTFAGKSGDKRGQISKKPNTLKARKVTVDRLGRIRWAND